jgi:hypothetical protein
MDVSDLRKAILRALDDARREAVDRRVAMDEASQAYRVFLDHVATPLLRQAVTVLRAEGQSFSLETPAESVRLVSDTRSETFLELALDRTAARPQVLARVSVARGRQGHLIDEGPLADGKAVALLTEQDVTLFLVTAIPKMVLKPS